MSKKNKPKHKGYYVKDGKKVSTKRQHSETYNNETYKYVKEGGKFGAAGKGDADRTSNRQAFRDNYDDIFEKK
tara:strand:+ start:460 stop:678 length:219 start_codon:yes stop_codon:yes gene_type:complete